MNRKYKFGDWVTVNQYSECSQEYKGKLAICVGTRKNDYSNSSSEMFIREAKENPIIVFVAFDYIGVNHRVKEFYPKEITLVRKACRPQPPKSA